MEINILIEEEIDPGIDIHWLQNIVEKVFIKENIPSNFEFSLVITGQDRIQELNREYRGKDRPTDVLSFAMSEQNENETVTFVNPPDGLVHLGEVLISFPQAILQAKAANHSVQKEMTILIVHGILHILGYDHEKKELAPAMKTREKEILAGLIKEKE